MFSIRHLLSEAVVRPRSLRGLNKVRPFLNRLFSSLKQTSRNKNLLDLISAWEKSPSSVFPYLRINTDKKILEYVDPTGKVLVRIPSSRFWEYLTQSFDGIDLVDQNNKPFSFSQRSFLRTRGNNQSDDDEEEEDREDKDFFNREKLPRGEYFKLKNPEKAPKTTNFLDQALKVLAQDKEEASRFYQNFWSDDKKKTRVLSIFRYYKNENLVAFSSEETVLFAFKLSADLADKILKAIKEDGFVVVKAKKDNVRFSQIDSSEISPELSAALEKVFTGSKINMKKTAKIFWETLYDILIEKYEPNEIVDFIMALQREIENLSGKQRSYFWDY